MKIGFVFFGISYGQTSKTFHDFRHCWPDIEKTLIEPFKNLGHECKKYISTYPFTNMELKNEFDNLVQPDKMYFSSFVNSDPFTCKGASFNAFENDELDFIILTRLDIHFKKILATQDIRYDKFNFLYPEYGDHWWEILRFTTDNVYMWPHSMTPKVKESLLATYRSLRPEKTDTHALLHKLCLRIPMSDIHFISTIPERSDNSSFYSLCRR